MYCVFALAGADPSQIVVSVSGDDGPTCLKQHMNTLCLTEVDAPLRKVSDFFLADYSEGHAFGVDCSAVGEHFVDEGGRNAPLLHPQCGVRGNEVAVN